MAVDLHIDNRLIEKAIAAGRHKSADEAVNTALEEYVRVREGQGGPAADAEAGERLKILDWVGKVDYFDDYDHKELRRKLR